MKIEARLSLAGCICIALLLHTTGAAYGQTEGCCLPDDTCQNATALSCAIDLGGTPQGVGSACQGDNNGDGLDDLCVSPILISEYYESAGGFRKCIELFNPGTVPFDLGANGYRIAGYTAECVDTGNPEADARGIYTFGTLGVEVVPAGGVYVICAVDNGDGYPIDLLLPRVCASCSFSGGGCPLGTVNSPIGTFTGDDAIVLFGTDISAPFDNVVDAFAVPFEGDAGPRGADPYKDAAWERKFTVTNGVRDLLGFDSCNFDGLKAGTTTPAPPGTGDTPQNATCLAALDTSTSNQWIFEGLNPSTDNQNHTLGSHVPDAAPIALNVQAITRLNTSIQVTLSVNEIDGDPFDVFVDTLPVSAGAAQLGTLWDGDPAMGGININVAGVPYTMTTSFVTFVPAAGVGSDVTFTYHAEQIAPAPPQIGNTATASILVEDESVIMTEVLYDPAVPGLGESQWEWVEIVNTTGSPVTLGELNSAGCPDATCGDNLWDGATPLSIGPGEILVIVGNKTTSGGAAVPERTDQAFLDLWGLSASQVYFVDSIALKNFPFLTQAGVDLFLRDETGDLIDFVPAYVGAPFPANDAGSSIFLTSTDKDNGDGANWATSVVDCANGTRQVSDGSIASPGAAPGAGLSVLSPCAASGLVLTQVGAPTTTKTVTLQGTLGGGAPAGAALGFRITKLPFVVGNGFDVTVGTLHDGPTAGGAVLTLNSLVTDPGGEVTLVETTGIRHFINFEFKAVEALVGGGTGAESPAARQSIAVQANTLVITEIMANPANDLGGESYWEYLEVRNTSASSVILGSMQSTNGPTNQDLNINGSAGVTIPGNTTVIIARDARDGSTVRTKAEFEAEWNTATPPLSSSNVIYVPNLSSPGGSQWDGFTNNPSAPGRFVTVWDNTNTGELDGLLDLVVYQNGQDGWPTNSQPNSIFYRGDANGTPFTTAGNDDPQNWQESTAGCPGDASFDSFANPGLGDSTVDHGSPLALPGDPDQCLPASCVTCPGDMDGNSKLDGDDIQLFIDVVTAPGFPLIGCADMDGDGNALDYLPDVSPFVDALVFGSTDCPVTVTHSTDITIELSGTPAVGDIAISFRGCDPLPACDELVVSPSPFICFELVSVTAATTAVQLAEQLAFGFDGGTPIKNGIGGLDEFCFAQGADVNVTGSTISIVFTRTAGQAAPCCWLQDTDGRFSNVSPIDLVLLGGADNCAVSNLLNGVPNDEGAAQGANGFSFTKTGD